MENKFVKTLLNNWLAIVIVITAIVIFGVAYKNLGSGVKAASETPAVEPPKDIAPVENPMSTDEMKKTIKDAVAWLKAAQEESGHFAYEYNPETGTYYDDDNMVRQTGAFYGIGEVMAKDENNTLETQFGLKDMMGKSAKYFEENTVDGEYNGIKFKCILKREGSCSLGAGCLGLIGLLNLVQKYPELGAKYSTLIEGYKNYIIAMKKPKEGFLGNFRTIEGVKQSLKESTFSNGEAQFALVRYYMYKQDTEVRKIIEAANEYFSDYYSKHKDGNYYLWGVAAMKDWYKIEPDDDIFDFVKPYTDWRISKFASQKKSERSKSAYIEGLAIVYPILADNMDEDELQVYKNEIEFWLKRTKDFQLKEGFDQEVTNTRDNTIKKHKLTVKNPAQAHGGFLTAFDEPVQRIDFTQHSMNSYLQWLVDVQGEKL